jgi:P-aminobenzoate N-oxygenase AurF
MGPATSHSAGHHRSDPALVRLIDRSVASTANPFVDLDWPESLPTDQLWMSPELMSVWDTPAMDELTDEQLIELSRWESINFYSGNVNGIRDLLIAVVARIHTTGFEEYSDYLSHFLREEVGHMWFFATFCRRYGGKIYPVKRLRLRKPDAADVEDLIALAQILIFEEIGHFFNRRLAHDGRLPDIVRQINRAHYEDEARHVAMGRHVVCRLYERVADRHGRPALARVEDYLSRYTRSVVEAFYSPDAYLDAGLDNAYELRRKLLGERGRRRFHEELTRRPHSFLVEHLGFEPGPLVS